MPEDAMKGFAQLGIDPRIRLPPDLADDDAPVDDAKHADEAKDDGQPPAGKQCKSKTCQQVNPAFYRDSSRDDGFDNWCKPCRNERDSHTAWGRLRSAEACDEAIEQAEAAGWQAYARRQRVIRFRPHHELQDVTETQTSDEHIVQLYTVDWQRVKEHRVVVYTHADQQTHTARLRIGKDKDVLLGRFIIGCEGKGKITYLNGNSLDNRSDNIECSCCE